MGEPGGLPSMGSHRVGHDWSNLAAAAAAAAAEEEEEEEEEGINRRLSDTEVWISELEDKEVEITEDEWKKE